MSSLPEAIYDLQQLFSFREALETLDLTAPPTARVLFPQALPPLRRVGILCGSFNPLTLAHTELAERAAEAFQLDRVFFTLAKVTVEKEQVSGMCLEDRLLLLSLYAQRHAKLGVALVNRGLYFEQAQAFRVLLGEQTKLSFLVGMDKLLQIFDPRYYQDRDVALRQLFSLASLIVANRGAMDQESFSQLINRPENRPYQSHLRFFSLPATVTDLSATAIRHDLAAGREVSNRVPEEAAVFLAETRAYHPPLHRNAETLDPYAVRVALLAALYPVRSWAVQEVDFHHLLRIALSSSEQGRTLRHALGKAHFADVLRSSLHKV